MTGCNHRSFIVHPRWICNFARPFPIICQETLQKYFILCHSVVIMTSNKSMNIYLKKKNGVAFLYSCLTWSKKYTKPANYHANHLKKFKSGTNEPPSRSHPGFSSQLMVPSHFRQHQATKRRVTERFRLSVFYFYRGGDVSFLIFVNFQGAMCFFQFGLEFQTNSLQNHTFIIENTHCCTATGSTARSQGRWVRCSSCWIKWVEGIDKVGWIVLDYVASWWFQPIWKTWIKIQNLPQVGVKIKNIWNHHLGWIMNFSELVGFWITWTKCAIDLRSFWVGLWIVDLPLTQEANHNPGWHYVLRRVVHINFDLPLLLRWGVDPIYEAIVVVSKKKHQFHLVDRSGVSFQHLFSGRAICVLGNWAVFWPLIFPVPRVWMLGMGEEVKPVECPKCHVNQHGGSLHHITSIPTR